MSHPIDSSGATGAKASENGFGAFIKGAFRSVGKQPRKTLADDNESSGSTNVRHEGGLPAYRRQAESNVTIDPNISYDAPDTVGRDLAFHLTGTDGGGPAAQANLVIGHKNRSMTLQEKMTLVQKYPEELDSLTAEAPTGGYPPHSAELFKTKQLVTTLLVLTNIEAPTVAVSQEYLKRIGGLTATHQSMLERQKEWADGQ